MRRLALAAAVAGLSGVLAAVAFAAPPATIEPGKLTVGVSMPSEGFQVGAVKGSQVVLARGYEIDLARALASRLELSGVAFVQSRFDRLISAGEKPFDVAIAEISVTDARRSTVDFSQPYMQVDQGVLAAQTLTRVPTTIAGLRPLRLCAQRKTTGADLVQRVIRPQQPPLLAGNVPTMLLNLQTGRCDAVVYDAPPLGILKSRAPARYGPFVGVIRTDEEYAIALPKGSPLTRRVDKALAALAADGTLDRLEKRWLTTDLSRLRVLR